MSTCHEVLYGKENVLEQSGIMITSLLCDIV